MLYLNQEDFLNEHILYKYFCWIASLPLITRYNKNSKNVRKYAIKPSIL